MSKRVESECPVCGSDYINVDGECASCNTLRYNQANQDDFLFLMALFPMVYGWSEEHVDVSDPYATGTAPYCDDPCPTVDESGNSWDFEDSEFDMPESFDGGFDDDFGGWD